MESVHGALTLHRVKGPDDTALLRTLSELSGSSDPRKFPGSNPCSLERADFPKLRQQPYYLAEKTDGIRVLLLCCTHAGHNVCAIVDRAMAMWLLPLQALPTAMFQGSVVDCELAFNKVEKQWQLLAFDAYVVSAVPVFYLPFSQRMAALARAMTAYAYTTGDPAPLKMKTFVPASMFDAYPGHEAKAAAYFDIDGLILTPELSHAVIGRHTELFKLKTKHTIDFHVASDGMGLEVFDTRRREHVRVARLRQWTQPGGIVECLRVQDDLWDVVTTRTDKTTANDFLTYRKTLLNAQENITLDELKVVFAE